jgi:hypothetical protein
MRQREVQIAAQRQLELGERVVEPPRKRMNAPQREVRPRLLAINSAFALASALVATAGAVLAVKLGAIEPYGMFGLQWSIDALTMVIIDGVGLRLGPLVGVVFVIARRSACRLPGSAYCDGQPHSDRANPVRSACRGRL